MLLARLKSLPDTSALHAAIRGEPRGWGGDRHLLATVIDAIQANSYVTASALTGKRGRKPKRIQRPKASHRRVVSVAELIEKGEEVE